MKLMQRNLSNAIVCMLLAALILLAVSGCRMAPSVSSTASRQTSNDTQTGSAQASTTSSLKPITNTSSGVSASVSPIRDITQAKTGSRTTIAGQITRIERHSGGNVLVHLQDATGTMPVFFDKEIRFDLLVLSVGLRYQMAGKVQAYQGALELVPSRDADIQLQDGNRFESVRVTRITDGDTVTVEGADGKSRKIRILGVDSPEMPLNGNPAEPFALEAKAFTEKMLLNRTVYLERDNSDTDDYGRQLRYVWLDDPGQITAEAVVRANFSAQLISGGYAAAYRSGDDSKYGAYFLEYEVAARETRKGMWQNG